MTTENDHSDPSTTPAGTEDPAVIESPLAPYLRLIGIKMPTAPATTTATKTAPVQPAKPPRKKPKKKRPLGLYIGGAVVLILGVFIWWGAQPIMGTMHYGVCKVFAEQQLPYPHTMKISSADQYSNVVYVYYTATNPFGEYEMDRARCEFLANKDGSTSYFLKSAKVNKLAVSAEKIKLFNQSVPAILQNPPDLALPGRPGEGIENLRRQS